MKKAATDGEEQSEKNNSNFTINNEIHMFIGVQPPNHIQNRIIESQPFDALPLHVNILQLLATRVQS
jgi:hypothetical protein